MKANGPNNLHGIILASGHGRRFRAITNPSLNRFARPKAMLPVGNRLLIDFSIEAMKRLGINRIHVGAGPRPLSEIMERHITNQDLHQIEARVHTEEKILDTAGTAIYLMKNFLDAQPNDTICILPCDTPHNIDLRPIYTAHLQKQAAATIAVLPIKWSSTEWKERTFGTVLLEPMPNVKDYEDRNLFEDDMRRIAKSIAGETFRVEGFYEQEDRERSQSNLINTGIYFFQARLLMDLAPLITSKENGLRFSDFGLHVFPLLGGRHEEFSRYKIDPKFVQKVKEGKYPFHAYLLPIDAYWRDVGNPLALLGANMDVLDGKIDTQFDSRYWQKSIEGWVGNFGSKIEASLPLPAPGTIGSIIGNHVLVEKGAKIERSVILDHTVIGGETTNSIIFPGTPRQEGIIGRGVKLVNSIYVGGELRYLDVPRTIHNRIVFELTKEAGGGIAYAPL